jgi:hypothetical protein
MDERWMNFESMMDEKCMDGWWIKSVW